MVLKPSHLKILCAVADYGSFSEAALQLQISQSAVSYAIATLEDELGIVLFSRGRHGATLSPIGDKIVERARQILSLMDDIADQANRAKGLGGGSIRISAFRSAATHILPDVIAQFCQRYPKIAISISEYDDRPAVEADLQQGKADVGIVYLPASPDLDVWELQKDEFVVLMPPSFELKGEAFTWEMIQSYPLIMAPEGDSCDAMVYDHSAQSGITLKATYHVRSDATIVNMVAKGIGAAISPKLAAEPLPPDVQVYSLPVPLYRHICFATLTDALLSPAAYAFLDLLKASAQ
mgnify:CR=1 FL=1